jgi:hypothetical protein
VHYLKVGWLVRFGPAEITTWLDGALRPQRSTTGDRMIWPGCGDPHKIVLAAELTSGLAKYDHLESQLEPIPCPVPVGEIGIISPLQLYRQPCSHAGLYRG